MTDLPADAGRSRDDRFVPPAGVRRGGVDRQHVVPSRVQTFGMWIFLVGLAILFFSGMVAYVFIRLAGPDMPAQGYLRPAMENPLLFTSTGLVLAASLAIHMSVVRVRREKRRAFLTWLILCDVLALAFVAVQTPAMISLLGKDVGVGHALEQLGPRPTRLYGLVFFFVLIHALHVLGGIIYLAFVTTRAFAGRYDHEHTVGVRHAALYWHFLDVVWLMMFGTFLVVG